MEATLLLDVRLGSARGIPAMLAIPVPAEATIPSDDAADGSASGSADGSADSAADSAADATADGGAAASGSAVDERARAADGFARAADGFAGAGVGPAAALDLIPEADRDEAAAFLDDVEHKGKAGKVEVLPRPGRRPERWLFVGIGDGGEAGWRSAGAALARKASKEPALTVVLPDTVQPDEVGALAEGLWLAAYRYRLGADASDSAPKLRRVTLVAPDNTGTSGPPGGPSSADPASIRGAAGTSSASIRGAAGTSSASVRGGAGASGGAGDVGVGRAEFEAALAKARVVVEATALARDLTNTPSARKTPAWMGRQIQKAASGITNLSVSVREPAALATEGFNGILAVGSGSANPPRLVELSWRPRGARRHVVLIGKGITFDTGGVCIKTRPGMKLMRKDMGGAAAVLAATLAAGTLRLPIRITALAPLAENSLGADSYRPGDVIRHYGGQTSEITNTDAEGRVVLADAIGYAVRRLRPDVIVDMATLTGAQGVALGKRTAAIFSDSDALAKDLQDAGEAAGESIWRMPLLDDYLDALSSDVADRINSTDVGAGAVMAALYLREFTGSMRDNWAHIDMSSPAWSESNDGETVKGATGWGVRTLLRWLESAAG
jgi:leucyl aminopeptidase